MLEEPILFGRATGGATGCRLPECDVPGAPPSELIPQGALRESPPRLPEVYEWDIVRHYTRLSQQSYGVDVGVYPLGSCTMKHNPRLCEDTAGLEGFAHIHPLQPPGQRLVLAIVDGRVSACLLEDLSGVSPAAVEQPSRLVLLQVTVLLWVQHKRRPGPGGPFQGGHTRSQRPRQVEIVVVPDGQRRGVG